MDIKAIIFDFDGTLVESMDVKARAFAYLFRNYPDKVGEIVALHTSHGGVSRFEKFERIYRDILVSPLSAEKKEQLSCQFSNYAYQEILKCPLAEGARDFLEKYHDKPPLLFIASGTPDGEMKSIVRDMGLKKYFKGVYGSPTKKKDIILKIMEDCRFKPEEVIFVGDSIDDKEGANGAGVGFIMRTKESNPYKELEEILKNEAE